VKKAIIAWCVLLLLLVPAAVSAQLAGAPLPAGAVRVEAWQLKDGRLATEAECEVGINVQVWRSGGAAGSCNRGTWTVDFTNHASLAQWSTWSVTGTRWDWRVLKPGDYAANCMSFTIQSNSAVLIDYEGFGDLTSLTPGGVKQTIDTYYGYGPSIEAAIDNGWVRSFDLNDSDDIIGDSAVLHSGWTTKLFTRIVVDVWNSSGEYEDTATVTLSLINQQPWVADDGGWAMR